MRTKISKAFGRVKQFARRHKLISTGLLLVLFIFGYWGVKAWGGGSGQIRYVTAPASRQTIIASITGTGQISASSQLDLKPKASGDVTGVYVTEGQHVKTGTLILQLDSQAAQKSVRDAVANLDSAKLSLTKLQQPADALSLTQSENSLARANDSKQNAQDDLEKAYDDGFSAVSNAFLELPSIMSDLYNVLYTITPSFVTSQWNIDYYANSAAVYDARAYDYRDDVNTDYQAAKKAYDAAFDAYKKVDRLSSSSTIEAVMNQTYNTTRLISQAIKSSNNLIQFYKDKLTEKNRTIPAAVDTHLSQLNDFTGQINTHLNALLSSITTIKNDKAQIQDADRTIAENTESLAKLKSGADPLDLQTAQLTITQRQNALADAQEQLGYYSIRAPFDGTVAKINVKKFDSAGSGSAVATFISDQQLAEISLNEVDAAKVKTGQKATLTFDAIDGLSISGKVAEVDAIGTVSQGVVTYNVKISLDTQDNRIKPGMTVNAAIITDMKQNVLAVPSSAVKNQGGVSYVQVFDEPVASSSPQGIVSSLPPREQPVEVGLSNDTLVEITSGLAEGQEVVTRIINPSAQATSQAPSLFGGGARTGAGGGGNVRTIGR